MKYVSSLLVLTWDLQTLVTFLQSLLPEGRPSWMGRGCFRTMAIQVVEENSRVPPASICRVLSQKS